MNHRLFFVKICKSSRRRLSLLLAARPVCCASSYFPYTGLRKTKWESPHQLPRPSILRGFPLCARMCSCKAAFLCTSCASSRRLFVSQDEISCDTKTRELYIPGLCLIKEAPTRFELVIEVLQTFALPLGHGAISNNSIYNYEGSKILFLLH